MKNFITKKHILLAIGFILIGMAASFFITHSFFPMGSPINTASADDGENARLCALGNEMIHRGIQCGSFFNCVFGYCFLSSCGITYATGVNLAENYCSKPESSRGEELQLE